MACWELEIEILRGISSSSITMAPGTLILRRLTTHFANRIRQNQRLLSSHLYSSSALEEAPSSSSSSSANLDGVHMTDTCIQVLFLFLSMYQNWCMWLCGFSFSCSEFGFWVVMVIKFRVCERVVGLASFFCDKKMNSRNRGDMRNHCFYFFKSIAA